MYVHRYRDVDDYYVGSGSSDRATSLPITIHVVQSEDHYGSVAFPHRVHTNLCMYTLLTRISSG